MKSVLQDAITFTVERIMDKISPMMYNDYQVTEEALRVNRQRILERTK